MSDAAEAALELRRWMRLASYDELARVADELFPEAPSEARLAHGLLLQLGALKMTPEEWLSYLVYRDEVPLVLTPADRGLLGSLEARIAAASPPRSDPP